MEALLGIVRTVPFRLQPGAVAAPRREPSQPPVRQCVRRESVVSPVRAIALPRATVRRRRRAVSEEPGLTQPNARPRRGERER